MLGHLGHAPYSELKAQQLGVLFVPTLSCSLIVHCSKQQCNKFRFCGQTAVAAQPVKSEVQVTSLFATQAAMMAKRRSFWSAELASTSAGVSYEPHLVAVCLDDHSLLLTKFLVVHCSRGCVRIYGSLMQLHFALHLPCSRASSSAAVEQLCPDVVGKSQWVACGAFPPYCQLDGTGHICACFFRFRL